MKPTAFAIERARKPNVQTNSEEPRGDLAVESTSVDVWTKPSATCRVRPEPSALQCAGATVVALSGDVPVGSLEQARQAELVFDRHRSALLSEPSLPLCERQYTRLVGLRRSLASLLFTVRRRIERRTGQRRADWQRSTALLHISLTVPRQPVESCKVRRCHAA